VNYLIDTNIISEVRKGERCDSHVLAIGTNDFEAEVLHCLNRTNRERSVKPYSVHCSASAKTEPRPWQPGLAF
jgi:hypothetical protein